MREYLADSFLIIVDGDVEFSASCPDAFRQTPGGHGTRSWCDLGQAGRLWGQHRCGDRFRQCGLPRRLAQLCRGSSADIENLAVPAAIPVNGDALASLFVGLHIDPFHILGCGMVRKVHGLGNGVVGVVLKSGLNAHVHFRGDVMGGHEEPTHIWRNLLHVLNASHIRYLVHQLLFVEPLSFAISTKRG